MMKLTTLFIFLTFLQARAETYAQTVTISEKNASLEKVFGIIEKQTGYTFYYKVELLKNSKRVEVSAHQVSLEKVLDIIFQAQPLTYTIIEKNIVVRAKDIKNQVAEPLSVTTLVDVKGFVTSGNGWVENASIIVKRTEKGVIANRRGEFIIKGVEPSDILIVSAAGYQTQEVPIKGNVVLYIILNLTDNKLDEVIIRPYGQSTTRRLNTGSVSKIAAAEIQRQPVTNVLVALAGRVPGLTISQSSGVAGADVFFNIRGINSLNADGYTAAPLVIVDGVPYPNVPINNPQQNGSAILPEPNENIGYGSPLYSLNPSDIESVEILKDADATAIYGSRAANGVLLITTKRGKQGRTNLSITANTGFSLNARRTQMLNTQEFRALRREAFANINAVPNAGNAPDLFLWDSTKNTNWQNELAGYTAKTTDANLSFSGGQGGTSFLISGNFHEENTIFVDRRKSNKGGAHFTINNVSPNGKLIIGLSGMINFYNSTLPTGNFGFGAFRLPPNWAPYDATGNLKWDFGGGDPYNPYALLMQTYSSKGLTLNSNIDARFSILPGLDAKFSLGYSRSESEENDIRPKTSMSPAVAGVLGGSHKVNHSLFNSLNFEPQLQYLKSFGKGKLDVLAGATIMKTVYQQPFYVNATNFASDAFIDNWQLAGTYNVGMGYNSYQYASFFSRVNYNWKNKYIVNGSFRKDGSSRFGPGNRFGDFGAIGAAWLFSKEKAIDKLGILSYGKLRGSFGLVGSDNIENYAFFSSYQGAIYPYNSTIGLTPVRLANSDFKWESTTKLEGALELGFVKDRILITAAWYRNRTGNQLVAYPVSGQTGFATYAANLNAAKVENSGWEFDLNTINIQSNNFRWSTSLNVSLQRNKLLQFDNIEQTPYATRFVVGDPLASFYYMHYIGINAQGIPQYEDANKDGVIDLGGGGLAAYGKGDRKFAGRTTPDFYGGLINSLSYKGFQLDFALQFVKGQQKFGYLSAVNTLGGRYNVPKKAVDYIREQGLAKALIRPGFSANWFYYSSFSDAIIKDASFIRLNNVSLGYNLSEKSLKKIKLTAAKVFVQAQNLFVISNYDGFDPETGAVAVPPLLRVVGGFQFSF